MILMKPLDYMRFPDLPANALLALGGDMGCAGGPTLVGMISDSLGDNLKMGILAGIIFPVLLLFGILRCKKGNSLS